MKPLTVVQKKAGKVVSSIEYLGLLKKNASNRQWILKQLSQLGINTHLLEDYSLQQLYNHCEEILKSTYSIKYLGMNNDEMGIISRRLDPFKDSNFSLKNIPQNPYIISNYFYPKPLKVGYKRDINPRLDSHNLETQIISAFSKQKSAKENRNNFHKKRKSETNVMKNRKRRNKSQEFLRVVKCKKLEMMQKSESPVYFNPKELSSFCYSYSQFLRNGLIFNKKQTDDIN